MHLVIDVREACRQKKTGKGSWVHGFVSALLERNILLTLFTDIPVPPTWSGREHIHIHHIPGHGLPWHLNVARELRRFTEAVLYLSPTSYIVPALIGSKVSFIPIVHDLIAFQHEPHDFRARWIERLTLKRAVRHARQ